MPATRSRRVLLVLAIAGAAAAIAMFGVALDLAAVNASAAQRAEAAGVPPWALRPRSLDPLCDWIAVAGVAIAIGAAILLLAGSRAPRLPGGSPRRWTIDPLWKCGAWSVVGHALLLFAFTPLAEVGDTVTIDEDMYREDVIDDEPPPLPEDGDDDSPTVYPRYLDGPCMMGRPVLASIQPRARAEPFTSWNESVRSVEPVVLGIPTTSVASERPSLRRTMKHQLPRLAECYIHSRIEGAGMIVATFTIEPTGAVTDARAIGFDPAVAACVARLVREIQFARPSGGYSSEVTFPISFRGRGY